MDLLRSTISLRQLYYLVAVADSGSFTRAAERTHVAQPALSRQIAMLEAQIGQPLLERSRKGVTLTDGGVLLYSLARTMLERLSGVQVELRASKQRPAGVVNVALPPSVASLLVPQVVRELESRYPEITLRVEDGLSMENSRSLETAVSDFGIVPTADQLMDVEYEPLVRESMLLVEKRKGSRPATSTVAFEEIAKQKLILPPRSFHTRRVIDEMAQVAKVTLNIGYEQRSVTTIMSMVRDGLGATITNSPAVEQFWPTGSVTARRIVRPEITRTISIARPSKRRLSFAAQAVYAVVKRFAVDAVERGRWQGTPLC